MKPRPDHYAGTTLAHEARKEHPADERARLARMRTPTEIADELHLKRREVIANCAMYGVPIEKGRIDRKLFSERVGSPITFDRAAR